MNPIGEGTRQTKVKQPPVSKPSFVSNNGLGTSKLYFGEQSHALLQLSVDRLDEVKHRMTLNDEQDLNMDEDPDFFEYNQLM